MLEIALLHEDGRQRRIRADAPLTIGRDGSCAVQLRTWRVAREHARVVRAPGGLLLEDLGSIAGTRVNGKRVVQYGPIDPRDEIVVGPCLIRVRDLATRPDVPDGNPATGEAGGDPPGCPPPAPPGQTHAGRESASPPGAVAGEPAAAAAAASSEPPPSPAPARSAAAESAPDPGWLELRRRLHADLLQALDLRRRDVASMNDAMLRNEAERLLAPILEAQEGPASAQEREALLKSVVDEAVGLGPLEPLLRDPGITEIMVNRHDEIYVERGGRLERLPDGFSSEQAVLGVIERIVAPIGRRIDESSPMVDARLRDGSRVNAVIAPVALRGASLTIRKFPGRRLGMEDLVAGGSLDAAMARFLGLCVQARKNVIVSGGTGSGKTTLLNILSHCVGRDERIVTIEDAAELRLQHAHRVSLEARPPNLEGKGRITIRDLVRNALRMRPDRIVVGECRGAEALDMLAAMNTGHEGSLTTLHANSPRDALSRLETMVLMAGMDLPLAAVREQIAAGIDIIVQQVRLPDGRRLVSSIVEVAGLDSGRIQIQELFRHDRARNVFRACGLLPSFFDAWLEEGVLSDASLFAADPGTAPGMGGPLALPDGGLMPLAGAGR